MEVVDEIIKEEVEEFPKEKADDFFMQLVRGKDVTEVIETSRGKFTVKYPKQKDLIAIGRLTARNHMGIPVECFDPETETKIKEISTLEIVVVDGPDWWKNAKEENKNWNWGYVPDETFMNELFLKAYEFRRKVDDNFTKVKEKEVERISTDRSDNVSMEPGLFEGLSGSTGA